MSKPQRWTRIVQAHEHGGFVSIGDYMDAMNENQAALDAAVAAERAWFVQVLSEWDRTEDVEHVLRLRLAGPNVRVQPLP